MAIFGGYTGARVAPLPAGFMGAAMTSASNLQKGLAGLGEGIGSALKQYGKNKEESEMLSGLIEPAFQQAVENKSFYDRLSGKEAPPEARELSPEEAAGSPPGITHEVTKDRGVSERAITSTPDHAPDPAANFLSEIAGGKKLYEKFKAGDASRAEKKAILANLSMYNAKGEHLMKQFQMKQMFAQHELNQSVYSPIQGAETREAVPPIERFVSDNVPAERMLQLIGKYRDGGGNQVDPASGQTMGELAIGQNVDDEYLLETLKGFGDFDISQYMPNELSRKRQYRDEATYSDADLNTQATGLHSQIMELHNYSTGKKRQPRSYDGGQPMREDEISEKIISLSDEYEGVRAELGRRKGVDDYAAKRKAIEGDRASRMGPLQEEMSSWSQYFSGAGKPRPSQSDEAKQTRGTMHERQRELLAEAKSVNQQSKDALAKLATDNPEQHADAFPQPVQPGSQPDQPPMPHIKDIDLGYTEVLGGQHGIPFPDKVTPGEMREMTTAERKAQDIQTYVDAGGLLDNRAMAAIDAKYPEAGITSKPIAGVPGAIALFDQKTGKFLQVVTPPTLSASERAAVDAVTFKPHTGYTGVAPTKEEAVVFREQIADAGKTEARVGFLIDAAKKGKLDRLWWGKNKGEVQTAAGFLRASLRKEIAGPGSVSEFEQKMLAEVAADPSKLLSWSDLDIGRLSRILVEVNTSLESKAKVLGLTPTGTPTGGQATQAPPGHRAFDKTGTENK